MKVVSNQSPPNSPEHSDQQSTDVSMTSGKAPVWGLLLFGMMLGWGTSFWWFVTPATEEMTRMQRQMDLLQQSVLALTEESQSAQDSASLLASLRTQRAHLNEAQEVFRNFTVMQAALRAQR